MAWSSGVLEGFRVISFAGRINSSTLAPYTLTQPHRVNKSRVLCRLDVNINLGWSARKWKTEAASVSHLVFACVYLACSVTRMITKLTVADLLNLPKAKLDMLSSDCVSTFIITFNRHLSWKRRLWNESYFRCLNKCSRCVAGVWVGLSQFKDCLTNTALINLTTKL